MIYLKIRQRACLFSFHKITAFFLLMLHLQSVGYMHVRACVLTCGKYLHDRIISENIWVHRIRLALPLIFFIEVPAPSQERKTCLIPPFVIEVPAPSQERKTCLIPPFFIEVPVSSQESELSCMCLLDLSVLSLCTIYLHFCIVFWNCWLWYFWKCFSKK